MYSSDLGSNRRTTTTTHLYDQQITDHGDKYTIQLKTDDYQENEFNIMPRYYQNQLTVDAKHIEEDNNGGYVHRELHKVFTIPKHIDLNRYTYSYNKNVQELKIEMPYIKSNPNEDKTNSSFTAPIKNTNESLTFSYGGLKLTNPETILSSIYNPLDYHNNSTFPNIHTKNNKEQDTGIHASSITTNTLTNIPANTSSIVHKKPFDYDLFHRSVFRPQILETSIDGKTINQKKLLMSLDLPDYEPEDIKVSVQDNELIVKAEKAVQTNTRKSKTSFFQSTKLPPHTDIENLKSNYIDGKLVIDAPYLEKTITNMNVQGKYG